jgi:hypothetical protein
MKEWTHHSEFGRFRAEMNRQADIRDEMGKALEECLRFEGLLSGLSMRVAQTSSKRLRRGKNKAGKRSVFGKMEER